MKNKKTVGEAAPAPSIVVVPQSRNGIVGYLLAFGSLVTGGFFLNKYLKDKAADAEGAKIADSAAAAAASSITAAVNPSGISWLSPIDGTNAVQIMKSIETAIKGGKTYKEISDSYRKLTKGDSLEDDMKKELSSSQYQTFLNVIKLNTKSDIANSSNFKNPVNPAEVLSNIGKVTVRKTPYINGTISFFDRRGNAIELIEEPGTFIGIATGKYKTSTSRDTILADKASTATVFYEVMVTDATYKLYNVWVAASQIKVSPKGTKPSSFKKIYVLKLSEYNKAEAINAPFLEGIEDLGNISKLLI